MSRAVVVFGGNAFASERGELTMRGQFDFAKNALAQLGPLLDPSTQLVISHGNGPQVGHMLIRVEEALGKAYAIPLEVCVAESEGELGYVLEQSLYNTLAARGLTRPIVTMLSEVVVDPRDPAFERPDKPVGPFYSESQARDLRARGFVMREDAGRGHRRVVPSPRPIEILGAQVIGRLIREMGAIVIAAGGGGIPVVREGSALRGVDAVIDKDHAAALLGTELAADLLVILTNVPHAFVEYGKPTQRPIGALTVAQARELLRAGEFAPGSMQPKIEAAANFASVPGRRSIICDPPSLRDALDGRAGTRIETATSV